MAEYVVTWYNPEGIERHEQDWFETLEEAKTAIAEWQIKYPWNTYCLSGVIEVYPASTERPNSGWTITFHPVT